jgi:hypothetical protein
MLRASALSALEDITRRGIGLEELEPKDVCVRTVHTGGQTHQEAVIVGFADSTDRSREFAAWAKYNLDPTTQRWRDILYRNERPVDEEQAARIKKLIASQYQGYSSSNIRATKR